MSSYWLDIRVSGHRGWHEVGLLDRTGRRWRWTCSAEAPSVGREATRREARIALLDHIRTGSHQHLGSPTP